MSAHHAYFFAGDTEEGIQTALSFAEKKLGLKTEGNPDVIVLRYGLFSVEEARMFQNVVLRAPVGGDTKIVIVSATRFFFQAQNALLKTFEEPPAGTYLVLVLPNEGVLLPTLRSRLVALERKEGAEQKEESALTQEFLKAGKEEREKLIAKLLDRTKSDADEEKARARADAVNLVAGLTRTAYASAREKSSPELVAFLSDMDTFAPLLHDTSPPLKLIFEHVLLTVPTGLK